MTGFRTPPDLPEPDQRPDRPNALPRVRDRGCVVTGGGDVRQGVASERCHLWPVVVEVSCPCCRFRPVCSLKFTWLRPKRLFRKYQSADYTQADCIVRHEQGSLSLAKFMFLPLAGRGASRSRDLDAKHLGLLGSALARDHAARDHE